MKVGRNDPCHCGSGKKYKKCCLSADSAANSEAIAKENIRQAKVHMERQDVLTDALAAGMVPDAMEDSLFEEIEDESLEYQALNDWAREYANTLPEGDSFRNVLLDDGFNHKSLIQLAQKLGHSQYADKAIPLYQAWYKSSDYFG
ncbi:SEC-C metal-binding domain-containing protein [Microbulbifer aggregans]|uniref:SEC-C metal-binding domain-containing protein n=1 Tax=Microbulbifer aggregans TaxID=1769779 RepID=UPI001CFCA2A5|nr:SEC-C metal-binding domain-containing protein [Microbulbifer aggregans]